MKSDKIFFTADHHFGHANIIKYTKRFRFMNEHEAEIMRHGSHDKKEHFESAKSQSLE